MTVKHKQWKLLKGIVQIDLEPTQWVIIPAIGYLTSGRIGFLFLCFALSVGARREG